MSDGRVHLTSEGRIATIRFDRPEARNAMTWTMYRELEEACARVGSDAAIRAVVLRGTGGEAFVAGTDIKQFATFTGAEDGIAYEASIERVLGALDQLSAPTVAVVEGYAVGGGLLIAAACDLRIATPDARFGAPIARTVGNCLSMPSLARLVAAFGIGRVQRMLLLAELLDASEALSASFISAVVAPAELDARIAAICASLESHAPVTLAATKEGLRRLIQAGLPGDEDLLRRVYGSRDFSEGVAAFVARRRPEWQGR